MECEYYVEYVDYMVERVVTDSSRIDLDELTMHYYSGGPCDPIEPIGMYPRYTRRTINVPDWLVAALGRDKAVMVMTGAHDSYPMYKAVRYLARESRPGKYYRSLIDWYVNHGQLTPRQIDAVLYPRW
jgi:hypothetical protein